MTLSEKIRIYALTVSPAERDTILEWAKQAKKLEAAAKEVRTE